MTIRWERFAGDTSAFALKLAFAPDPDEGQGVDRETGLSWGSFQVWVQGRNLCAYREENENIDSVHWYLLPLLEWFAGNWDALLHEERLPAKNAGESAWESLRATRFAPPAIEDDEDKAFAWEGAWQDWWFRHALQAAAEEGGLFPNIVIRRLRDRVELSWGSILSAVMPNRGRFTGSERGFALLEPQAVAEALHEVLAPAARYLLAAMPDSRRIQALDRKLRRLKAGGKAREDNRERRLAWLAGLGTSGRGARAGWRRAVEQLSRANLKERPRQALLEVAETPLVVTGPCHAALMFASLAPEVREADVQELARAMVGLDAPRGESGNMCELGRAALGEETDSPPWEQGYDLAEEVHEHFDGAFERGDRVDVEGLIAKLGVRIGELELSDARVRGVAIAGPRHRPGIFVNRRHAANHGPAGRRFTLAHGLCHLLFDRKRGQRLAVASGPWAPRASERRANAFAAMLSMPAPLVRRCVAALPVPLATNEGIDQVAQRLCAGRLSALRHLTDLGFVDEADRQRLEEQRLEHLPPSSAKAHAPAPQRAGSAALPAGLSPGEVHHAGS